MKCLHLYHCRLEVLITLGLSSDEAIQEYATEALAELLIVPAIQVRNISTYSYKPSQHYVKDGVALV